MSTVHTGIAPNMVQNEQQNHAATNHPNHHTNVAAAEINTNIEGQDSLISPDSFRKSAERFGWSASVWLSKHLNGRQPALMAKPINATSDIQRRLNERRLAVSLSRSARQCYTYRTPSLK